MKMYFRLFLLLAVIGFTQQSGYAQQTEKASSYQVKMYYNSYHSSGEFGPTIDEPLGVYEYASADFGRITPAFVITKNRIRHEMELSNFGIKRDKNFEGITDVEGVIIPVEGEHIWAVNVGLRYEFAFNLLKEELRHGLFVGASVQPYFDYLNTKPITSASFPTDTKIFGTKLHLIPRYTYDIGKKWFLDVNFPIEAMNILAYRLHTQNPILSEQDRIVSDVQGDFFAEIFQFRIGIGLKL